jgi:hypothetical protein
MKTTPLLLILGIAGSLPPVAADEPSRALDLGVERRLDLSHVQPARFAAALGRDPARIFEFVRDRVAVECYPGCLRGPRGTLLAMAGNSTDRAALLADLLERAGQKARFARGTLSDAAARKQVSSMWAPGEPGPAAPAAAPEMPEGMKDFFKSLRRSVQRDYPMVRDALARASRLPADGAVAAQDELVKEAQDHIWVQWNRGGEWVDLDPSSAEARIGDTVAKAVETFDRLPESLFHRVLIRGVVEEATGGATATRTVLTFEAPAAELSGADLLLTHQPEGWKGPVKSVGLALESAIATTGAIKAVLITDRGCVAGEPFFLQAPPGGIGGVKALLGGAGTRKPAAIAVAESIEIQFIGPGGEKETVVRQVFDRLGKAFRAGGKKQAPTEIESRLGQSGPFDPSAGVYDLFFTTGGIHLAHLVGLTAEAKPEDSKAVDVRNALRCLNVTMTALSDGLLRRIQRAKDPPICSYPVSPRVLITDVRSGTAGRLTIDLRRSARRVATANPSAKEIFLSNVLRGIVDGALERTIAERVSAGQGSPAPAMSTSLVFEAAAGGGVPIALLAGAPPVDGSSPAALAWLGEDLSRGFLAIAPSRAVPVGDGMRLAWWRVDPRSGETTPVTDEGLNQATAEYTVCAKEDEFGETVYYVAARNEGFVILRGPIFNGADLAKIVNGMMRSGATLVSDPWWLGLVWP